MKINPYYKRQKICSTMTVVYGNIRFMRMFAGVPWRDEASNDSGVIENVNINKRNIYEQKLHNVHQC